ncbi:hypothetical protein BO79DRAFT_227041 [Aspergillus costaricaensis CBS 115574]|uniref:Uncharacterized protein n=1 Tax=Aspergillus costaricaensis CBS 115574 TaxID=1448317 RepID=A0ACD1IJ10_9EURO|nr:hypothetical protein BO79DRAFT_227041 [Aspergillus costaricaensis CBS 115574]RAK90091.1 hypothetical protein BO79DRAFT_227041 [Aspergillus costaricaensis CBS 115574]
MQDITKPSRALLRSTYNDEEIPSNSAYYLAVNGDLAQRYLRIIDMSWMHARLPRNSRGQSLLPLADTGRNQAPPPIASISVPNTSQTSGRRIRRVRRQDSSDTLFEQSATDRPPGPHKIRRKELGDFFKLMFEKDFLVIFICWGRKERCQIVPVVITDPTDEVTAWQAVSREFYAQRGVWAKYLPWFCVNKVEIVDISIAGQKLANDHRSTGIEYVGIYNSEDSVAKRKHLEQVIADYKPQDWPCPYKASTGAVYCHDDCVTSYADYAECPERTKFRAERELSLLSLRPILTQCFFQAKIAAHNHLLSRERLIHDSISRLDDRRQLGRQFAAYGATYESNTNLAKRSHCKRHCQRAV